MALMYNFDDLTEETQNYLKKAMDIYAAIEEKNLIYKNKALSINDKKVFSLFMAGFLVDGNLKNIVSQYDIEIKDLLDFVKLDEKDIVPLDEHNIEYGDYYNSNFKQKLMGIVSEGNVYFPTNHIILSPELVFFCLRSDIYTDSLIISIFGDQYMLRNMGEYNLIGHEMFKVLKASLVGCVVNNIISTSYKKDNNDFFPSFTNEYDKAENVEYNKNLKKDGQKFVIDERVWKLLEDIKTKFIGQEYFVEDLFYNIINNQRIATNEDIPDGERSIIFVDGPTGTGKTAITKEITEKLGIPFTSTSITSYSATGYKGGDLTDLLRDIYKKAGGDLEKAQRGIIVIDEIDKIAYSRSGGLEMKKAVQQQLLDFLGGGKYNISIGSSIFDFATVEFDTSKLTFVCLGALTDLRSKKTEKKHTIGFGQTSQSSEEQTYSITPQDLISIGLEKELVGRFNTYLHTDDYSKESLERILRESTISPLIGFKKLIESVGKQFVIDDEVYPLIVEQAYELNTGARSLQTVMNNIRTPFIKKLLRGTDSTIHLNCETVNNIYGKTMNRKGRG